MNKEQLAGTKIEVKNPEESRQFQEHAFSLGITWNGGNQEVRDECLMLAIGQGGHLLRFTDKTHFNMHKYPLITLEEALKVEIPEEVTAEMAEIEKRVNEQTITTKKKPMTSKYVFADKVFEALETAFETGENIILYGPGGHAKSEISLEFLRDKGIDPYVKTLGAGTTTDQLFGGVDIKTFESTGKIEYLVENSFMNHEYVILEELMDAPDYILESLKDILTSKEFRNGTQRFPIKTKLIVCCTNKTREEFSKNDSLKALMERFPLEIRVVWSNYTRTAYNYLFKTCLGKDYIELEYIMEKLHQAGTTVSPRTAMKVAKMVDKRGLDCLDYVAEFSGKNALLVKQERDKYKNLSVIMELRKKITDLSNVILACDISTIDGIKQCKVSIKQAEGFVAQMKTKKADDDVLADNNKIIEKIAKNIKAKKDQMEKILSDEAL